MRKCWMAVVGGAAGLALVASGCGSDASAGDDGRYRVIVLGGLSTEGVLADNASTSVLAARASVEWVNEHGGIDGREVTIETIDDQGDPTVAVTKIREAVAEDTPDLVLTSGPSTITEAVLPILKQSKVLSFDMAPTESSADPDQFPLNFELSPSATDQIEAYLPYVEQQGYRSVGVLHGSSSYGETYSAEAESVFGDGGIDIVASEEYDVAALDMTAQLQSIRAAQPDALVLDAYGAPLGYVLKSLQKLGWDVPVIGNTSVSATSLINTPPPSGVLGTEAVDDLVMQVYTSTAYDPKDKPVNTAVDHMTSLGELEASLIVGYLYDTLPLVQAAVEDAGSTDPDAVAAALEKSSVTDRAETAILSAYNYSPDSHSPNAAPENFAFIAPAKLVDGQFH